MKKVMLKNKKTKKVLKMQKKESSDFNFRRVAKKMAQKKKKSYTA